MRASVIYISFWRLEFIMVVIYVAKKRASSGAELNG